MKKYHYMFLVLFFFGVFGLSFAQETSIGGVYSQQAILNAAYSGNVELVQRILDTNPDMDIRDSLGGTALHIAVFQANLEVIRLLLDHGFDINATTPSTGYTPLHYCVWVNNPAAARLLISRNADKQIKAHDGLSPAEKAAKEGKREILMELSR